MYLVLSLHEIEALHKAARRNMRANRTKDDPASKAHCIVLRDLKTTETDPRQICSGSWTHAVNEVTDDSRTFENLRRLTKGASK